MQDAVGTPRSLVQRWQWSIEIDGFDAALFSKATIPSIEFEETTFASAGAMFDHKAAGRATFDDITLEKGQVQDGADDEINNWLRTQMDLAAQTGGVPSEYMRDFDLVQRDRHGNEYKRYRIKGAWIKRFEAGDLEGASSENVIEVLTMAYQYYEMG